MSIEYIKQIIEDADVGSLHGLAWYADHGEYLQVDSSADWEQDMAGVTVDDYGELWISADAVAEAEAAQARRVASLLEAGYLGELAWSQRFGFDQQAAEIMLSQ